MIKKGNTGYVMRISKSLDDTFLVRARLIEPARPGVKAFFFKLATLFSIGGPAPMYIDAEPDQIFDDTEVREMKREFIRRIMQI